MRELGELDPIKAAGFCAAGGGEGIIWCGVSDAQIDLHASSLPTFAVTAASFVAAPQPAGGPFRSPNRLFAAVPVAQSVLRGAREEQFARRERAGGWFRFGNLLQNRRGGADSQTGAVGPCLRSRNRSFVVPGRSSLSDGSGGWAVPVA
ncbi:hypothetical protein GCM10010922_15310 [Microbacterium sorbitolivorans]|nr:hypothetical protein GCM10010922_15310 [Microbacterium sorbitolivorans]